jgi:acyl dehydratase
MMTQAKESAATLDTSDVDKYVGQLVGGGQLKEPITVTDIRRWVQAMQYPNPRHYDEEAAAAGPFGQIVAPQSFTVCCDAGHGSVPAIVGRIPDSHVVFGGDEWWFYGPRIYPGDSIRVRRRFDGYKMAETKFAGPTMFSRGDTLYFNQRKDPVAKQRSTMVRYRPDIARQRGYYENTATVTPLGTDQLADIQRQRTEWMRSGQPGKGPGEIKVGDTLPTRPIGPHTVASFTTEFRAFIFSVWGTYAIDGHFHGLDAGWVSELSQEDTYGSDPMGFSMDEGPASGHTSLERAKLVGLPRHYGYGSSVGTWVLDYLAYWAGDEGFIRHANVAYRWPTFEGDVALLNGEIAEHRFEPLYGAPVATVRLTMTNQDGVLLANGEAEVQLSAI